MSTLENTTNSSQNILEIIKNLPQFNPRFKTSPTLISKISKRLSNDLLITIKTLLENDKNINIDWTDSDGYTALIYSSRYSKKYNLLEIVKLLIKYGANVNMSQNNYGWTSLMYASRNSNITSSLETVKLLIDSGAKLDMQNKLGWTSLMMASINSNDSAGESSLETVKLLINSGANLNIQNNDGDTALMLALKYSEKYSSLETVKLLINSGANLNIQNKGGDTSLMLSIFACIWSSCNLYNLTKIVKLLIDSSANLTLKNNKGETALTVTLDQLKLVEDEKLSIEKHSAIVKILVLLSEPKKQSTKKQSTLSYFAQKVIQNVKNIKPNN
uniref:Uncharacterized protein n=1 Tax=viral metagenome TaxID=1070528 RepID=A0A6C0E9M8_9ZZZZ